MAIRRGGRDRRWDGRGGRVEFGGLHAQVPAELDEERVGVELEEGVGVGHQVGQALVEVFQQGVAGELARAQVQITALVATAAIGLAAARRFNIPLVIPMAGTTLFGVGLPLINRATGWSAPR